jgi:hypothetical protein
MKVRDLLVALQNADPDLDVCQFADDQVISVDDVGVWLGEYKRPMGMKLIFERVTGTYVGLGNPGDHDTLSKHSVCSPIQDLTTS